LRQLLALESWHGTEQAGHEQVMDQVN
jgi:hypothetical protein